jgi:hypothetical protein
MPVEASDIVPIAMDSGGGESTGCEQTGVGSDERVGKRERLDVRVDFPTESTLRNQSSGGSRGNQNGLAGNRYEKQIDNRGGFFRI